jgi:hypothetical protein
VNGVHQNPQNIASSSNTEMLDLSTRFQFDQVVKSAKTKLSLAQTVAIARSLD